MWYWRGTRNTWTADLLQSVDELEQDIAIELDIVALAVERHFTRVDATSSQVFAVLLDASEVGLGQSQDSSQHPPVDHHRRTNLELFEYRKQSITCKIQYQQRVDNDMKENEPRGSAKHSNQSSRLDFFLKWLKTVFYSKALAVMDQENCSLWYQELLFTYLNTR